MGQTRSLNPQRTGPFPECPYAGKRPVNPGMGQSFLGRVNSLGPFRDWRADRPIRPHSGNGQPTTQPTKPALPKLGRKGGQSRMGHPLGSGDSLAIRDGGGSPIRPSFREWAKPLTRPTRTGPFPECREGLPLRRHLPRGTSVRLTANCSTTAHSQCPHGMPQPGQWAGAGLPQVGGRIAHRPHSGTKVIRPFGTGPVPDESMNET